MKTITSLLTAILLTAASLRAETTPTDPVQAASDALQKNNLAAAETLAAPWAQGDAPRPDACALLAEIRLRQKRTKDAIELLDRATTLDPKNAAYQSRLGIAISQRMNEVNFMQQGLLAGRMLKAFKRSIELDPNHVPGYLGLSRYYANAPAIAGGDMEKAVQYAEEAKKRDVFAGTLELGFLAERQEQSEAAVRNFAEALRLKPDQAWLHERTGRLLVKLGRTGEARARFEAALSLQPELASARQALAALPADSTAK